MPFEPGRSGNPGGRPKGVPNKATKLVKEAWTEAFTILQDDPDANLVSWGRDNLTQFYTLASKLIPTETRTELESGDNLTALLLSLGQRKSAGDDTPVA